MKKEIFVVNIGYSNKIAEVSIPTIEQYAKKIGAKFTIIKESKFPDMHPSYEKVQVYEFGKENDWNIIIDADMLFHKDMYDVTSLVPDDGKHIGCWESFSQDGLYNNRGIDVCIAGNFMVIPKKCIEVLKPLDVDEDYKRYCERDAYVNEYCFSLNRQKLGYNLCGLEKSNSRDILFKHINLTTDNLSVDEGIVMMNEFLSRKKSKNLVLTLSIGEKYKKISFLTHETIQKYAEKIEADFLVLDKQEISETLQWEKFRIYDFLNQYERIIYLDSDIIVRDDCPNLFDVVPFDKIGLFDESPFTDRQIQMVNCGLKRYYNTGVMVVSNIHKYVFKKPEKEINDFYEQTYLNTVIKDEDVFKLDYKFNRMCCMDGVLGVSRLDAYIVHYAGCPSLDLMYELIVRDIESWQKDAPGYKYIQRIHVSVSGGIGDQACAQPPIRFLRKMLPESEINVSTHFPRLFRDVKGINVFCQFDFRTEPDTPYLLLEAFPSPESLTYSVVSANLCNRVDYCSIALLKRILPLKDKRIKFDITSKDMENLIETMGDLKWDKLVLVHAGKHWDTKTFPKEYWEEIIDGLVEKGMSVCLIGKNGSPGVWNFPGKDSVINVVDLLDLDSLITLISVAKCVITNDSAPVHLAGAFDNEIIVIPTVNHPEHILPFREKKCHALYKKLLIDDYKTLPFLFNNKDTLVSNLDKMKYDWDRYLVEPSEVIKRAFSLFG